MSDTLITVENISEKFCRRLRRSWYGMKDFATQLISYEAICLISRDYTQIKLTLSGHICIISTSLG